MHITSLARPLRDYTYRRLFSAHVLALTATGLVNVGLGLLAFDLTPQQAGSVVATALTIKILIYVLAAPQLAAVFARFPTRNVLIGSDVARIAVGASLPFIHTEWQLYAAVACLQLAAATFTPAFQALIPRVLDNEDDFTQALTLSRIACDAEQILSPVAAALLLSFASQGQLFGVAALGFVASASLVAVSGCGGVGTRKRRARGGVQIMACTPELRSVLALNLALAAPTAMVLVNTVVLVRGELGRPESDVAVLLAACGIGSIAMALLVPRLRPETSMLGGSVSAVALLLGFFLLIDAAPSWPLMITLWCGLGASMSAIATPTGQVIRRNVDEADLGAVFAAQFSLSHACYLIAYPLAGWLGARVGLGWTALLLSFIALFAVVAAVNLRSVRQRRMVGYSSKS